MSKITRTVSALAATFAIGHGEALAQSPECATVYDQSKPGQVTPELEQAIGRFIRQGIDIHVQIFEDSRSQGIVSQTDGRNYTDALAERCDWRNPSSVNILISENPRVLDVYEQGAADRKIDQDTVDDALFDFKDNLRDRSTSFQEDAAAFLDDIDPSRPRAEQRNDGGGGSISAPDLPWGLLGGITGGIALFGAAGARIRRGFTLKREASGVITEAEKAYTDLVSASSEADDVLQIIPDDDALNVRAVAAQASEMYVPLDDQIRTFTRRYKREARGLWPNIDALRGDAQHLEEATTSGAQVAKQTAAMADQLNQDLMSLESMVTKFNSELETIHRTSESFVENGWKLDHLEDTLNRFDEVKKQIAALRDKNYIDKPADLIREYSDDIENFGATLDTLPGRRTEADATINTQPSVIEAKTAVLADVVSKLGFLDSTYDLSCYGDLQNASAQIEDILTQMATLDHATTLSKGVLSVAKLEQAEKDILAFQACVKQIDSIAGSINERIARLEKIESELPARVQTMQRELAGAREYAFVTHMGDVEEDTRRELRDIEEAFVAFQTDDIKKDKPAFLAIDKKASEFASSITSTYRKAQREREEMVSLRGNIETLASQIQSSQSSLNSYVSMHRSDVGSISTSFSSSRGQINLEADRASLHGQVTALQQTLDAVQSARRTAESRVREAEAARRRAAEAEAARRRAEESARQAAATASFTDWGGGGGGGGGTHTSSDW